MKAFRFVRARTCEEAAAGLVGEANARVHAGGVDLLDRMKERVDEPDVLVSLCDATGLDEVRIEEDGGLWIGARVTLAQLADTAACRRFLPTVSEAAGLAASPQLRHRATVGGNLAQHTRCGYYRHASFPCLKRGGATCPAREAGGVQEATGIFGNEVCASAHPSSVAPVLGSLGAEVVVQSAKGERALPFEAFWAQPKAGRASDTVLEAGDVIRGVRIPARDAKQFVGYAEVRQKQAFDWALVSCAVRYESVAGKILAASVWFGSLAPIPWRSEAAEAALVGQVCSDEAAAKAGAAAVAQATPLGGATYKVKLAQVVLKRALAAARGRA